LKKDINRLSGFEGLCELAIGNAFALRGVYLEKLVLWEEVLSTEYCVLSTRTVLFST